MFISRVNVIRKKFRTIDNDQIRNGMMNNFLARPIIAASPRFANFFPVDRLNNLFCSPTKGSERNKLWPPRIPPIPRQNERFAERLQKKEKNVEQIKYLYFKSVNSTRSLVQTRYI